MKIKLGALVVMLVVVGLQHASSAQGHRSEIKTVRVWDANHILIIEPAIEPQTGLVLAYSPRLSPIDAGVQEVILSGGRIPRCDHPFFEGPDIHGVNAFNGVCRQHHAKGCALHNARCLSVISEPVSNARGRGVALHREHQAVLIGIPQYSFEVVFVDYDEEASALRSYGGFGGQLSGFGRHHASFGSLPGLENGIPRRVQSSLYEQDADSGYDNRKPCSEGRQFSPVCHLPLGFKVALGSPLILFGFWIGWRGLLADDWRNRDQLHALCSLLALLGGGIIATGGVLLILV
jgi:hypothetical protein